VNGEQLFNVLRFVKLEPELDDLAVSRERMRKADDVPLTRLGAPPRGWERQRLGQLEPAEGSFVTEAHTKHAHRRHRRVADASAVASAIGSAAYAAVPADANAADAADADANADAASTIEDEERRRALQQLHALPIDPSWRRVEPIETSLGGVVGWWLQLRGQAQPLTPPGVEQVECLVALGQRERGQQQRRGSHHRQQRAEVA
jgi:hypothetical protein